MTRQYFCTEITVLNICATDATLWRMPKASFNEVAEALKNSLRDLERVRMTAPDDAELLNLKHEIRKMIKRAEEASRSEAHQRGSRDRIRRVA
jgi:hypothetical protein